MRFKACVFDLDGTLLNTLDDLANSTNAALQAYNLPQRTKEEVRGFVGNGVRKLIWRALPNHSEEALFEAVYARFLEVYAREKSHYTKPYPGIAELLLALKEQGKQLAVLSNKNDDAVNALCQEYFPSIFSYTQGMRAGIRPKPAPDALEEICLQLGIKEAECLYIGDSEVDVETAKAAHVHFIAASWGYRTEIQLQKAGATEIADAPQALLSLIRDLEHQNIEEVL